MSKDKYTTPSFSFSLVHPRCWGVWLGFGLLAIIVNLLPYTLLFRFGRWIGHMGMKCSKDRVHITLRNLQLAFPDKSDDEYQAIVEDNFKNTGLAVIETGISWFWPTWRFKRILIEKDIALLRQSAQEKQGVLLCCVHALNLEITARAFAVMGVAGHGVYRPHKNLAYDFIQCWGRSHNGNSLIDRKDVKQMIRVLRAGDRLFYLPDHDYGRNKSVFVPFFAVKDACTTTGTSMLVTTSHCKIILGSGFRNAQGKYDIIADVSIEGDYPQNDPIAAAAYINHYIEMLILRAPSQWMWLHKRFKTMADPSDGKACRYQ